MSAVFKVGAVAALRDSSFFLVDVGIGSIESQVVRQHPASTQGYDVAIAYRDTCGAVHIAGGGAILCVAGTQYPARVELVSPADSDGPGVFPVQFFRYRAEIASISWVNAAVFHINAFQAAPARVQVAPANNVRASVA